MAYKPKPGAPRNLREMFHYLWGELKSIESEGGGGLPGVTDHDDLTNVTPDQHHDQAHLLSGPDHTDVSDVTPTEGQIMGYESGLWKPIDAPEGATSHALLTDVQPDQHHSKVHFLVGKGPAGVHDHGDVQSDTFPDEGDILIYRGDVSTGEWKVEPLSSGGGDHARGHQMLNALDHTDVDPQTPNNGDVLTYSSTTSKWGPAPGAAGGQHTLYSNASHSDVFDQLALEEGSVLMYIASLGQFAALNVFTPHGYGGVNLQTPTVIANLTTNWEAIPMDANSVASPVSITPDLANNGLEFNDNTVWDLSILFNLAHNEDNAGREIQMRLYNVTDAVPGTSVYTFAVGRNQPGTTIAFNALIEVSQAQIDKTWQLQISGGTDSFTSVVARNAHFNATRHGTYSV